MAKEDGATQTTFLESLVDAMGAIASAASVEQVLEETRREAERLFRARAELVAGDGAGPVNGAAAAARPTKLAVPVGSPEQRLATLHLEREQPFERGDAVRARVLADFASRTSENARLLAEVQMREAERARLFEQLITAEQDERRRIALIIHDGPVQSMSGIALMLDAALHSLRLGQVEEATEVTEGALKRQRDAIRALRDLSFALEPLILRDQGFTPAVSALADRLEASHGVRIELDVEAADVLEEKQQVGLYQLVREALNQALARGPQNLSLRVSETGDGRIETTIADDGTGERRKANLDAIAERARTVNAEVSIDAGEAGGTLTRVVLPAETRRG